MGLRVSRKLRKHQWLWAIVFHLSTWKCVNISTVKKEHKIIISSNNEFNNVCDLYVIFQNEHSLHANLKTQNLISPFERFSKKISYKFVHIDNYMTLLTIQNDLRKLSIFPRLFKNNFVLTWFKDLEINLATTQFFVQFNNKTTLSVYFRVLNIFKTIWQPRHI